MKNMSKKENLSFLLLNMGYAEHHSDWNWYNVSNPFFRIYYVAKGHAWVTVKEKKFHLTEGHLYMIPPFTIHNDNCNSIFKLYYIHVFEEIQNNISIFDQKTFPFEIEATAIDIELVKKLLKINPNKELFFYDPQKYTGKTSIVDAYKGRNYFDFIESKGILLILFSRFLTHSKEKTNIQDNRILKIIKYIQNNLSEKIKIKDLSELCFLSEDHFIRLFKKEMGTTPVHYINRKKIEQCQLKILISQNSIQEIADSVSFYNTSYFNKLFKKIVGTTPTDFKKNYNTNNN